MWSAAEVSAPSIAARRHCRTLARRNPRTHALSRPLQQVSQVRTNQLAKPQAVFESMARRTIKKHRGKRASVAGARPERPRRTLPCWSVDREGERMRGAACAGGGGTNDHTHPRRSPAVQNARNSEQTIATPTDGARATRGDDGGRRGAVPLRLATTRRQATAESRGDVATCHRSTTADICVGGLRAVRRA